jgi:hypothetical protein
MRVSQFKDFNQQFDFLKSKPPLNAIRYRYMNTGKWSSKCYRFKRQIE